MARLKIFFDGGCRPNPGPIEVAVVAVGVVFHERNIGHGSNDEAEWLALIHALKIAGRHGAKDVQLLGDAAAVIAQANGARCRSATRPYQARFEALCCSFDRVRVRHIKRTQNLAGIFMAKRHSGR